MHLKAVLLVSTLLDPAPHHNPPPHADRGSKEATGSQANPKQQSAAAGFPTQLLTPVDLARVCQQLLCNFFVFNFIGNSPIVATVDIFSLDRMNGRIHTG